MNHKLPLADLVGELVDRQGSRRKAAGRIGISDVALGNIIKGISIPDPPTIKKIAAWSGLPEEYLMRQAGHLGPPPPRDIELEAMAEERQLRRAMRIKMGRIPLLGRIPASWPNYQEETLEGYVSVEEAFAKGRDLFALRVYGWSMVDAGISEGDIIIVDADCRLEIGDIVVADVDGEQTVKRYGGHNRDQVKLIPDNHDMTPFFVPAEQFRCIGVVVEVHKRFGRKR